MHAVFQSVEGNLPRDHFFQDFLGDFGFGFTGNVALPKLARHVHDLNRIRDHAEAEDEDLEYDVLEDLDLVSVRVGQQVFGEVGVDVGHSQEVVHHFLRRQVEQCVQVIHIGQYAHDGPQEEKTKLAPQLIMQVTPNKLKMQKAEDINQVQVELENISLEHHHKNHNAQARNIQNNNNGPLDFGFEGVSRVSEEYKEEDYQHPVDYVDGHRVQTVAGVDSFEGDDVDGEKEDDRKVVRVDRDLLHVDHLLLAFALSSEDGLFFEEFETRHGVLDSLFGELAAVGKLEAEVADCREFGVGLDRVEEFIEAELF